MTAILLGLAIYFLVSLAAVGLYVFGVQVGHRRGREELDRPVTANRRGRVLA